MILAYSLEKKKATDFCFLKAFSWETDLWTTLGDFTVKKKKKKKPRKTWKGNLYLTENRLGRNEMWRAADIHNYMCHIFAKGCLDSNFNQAVIDKISNFQEIAPRLTYSQKSYIFKYDCNFLNQLILPYEFYGRGM